MEALIRARANAHAAPVVFLGGSLDIFLPIRNRKHLPEKPKGPQE
jgi:hypothetical protein